MMVGAALVVGVTAGAAAVSLIGDREQVPPQAHLDRGSDGTLRLVIDRGDAAGADLPRLAEQLGTPSIVEVRSGQPLILRAPVVVRSGATLRFENLDVRLASSEQAPADIIADGGTVEIEGGRVVGWDLDRATFDRSIADGRAHLRAEGGRLVVDDALLSHLGDERSGAAAVWIARSEGLLRDSRVLDSERAVRIDGAQATVEGNVVARTRQEGLRFERCTGPVEVSDNRVLHTGTRGLKIARGCGGTRVENNDISEAGEDGIEILEAGPDIELDGNRVHRNTAVGITVTRSKGVQLSTNRVFDNGRGVVVRDRSREVEVANNLIVANREDGVHLDDGALARVSENTIRDNAAPGIRVEDGAGGSIGPGNVIVGNLDGIRISDQVAAVEVVDNEIAANAKDGFHLGRIVRPLTLTGNQIARNGHAAFSVTVEGVSRAFAGHNHIADHPRGAERVREAP